MYSADSSLYGKTPQLPSGWFMSAKGTEVKSTNETLFLPEQEFSWAVTTEEVCRDYGGFMVEGEVMGQDRTVSLFSQAEVLSHFVSLLC